MAITAVKTFVDAEPLYASDLNAMNTNILYQGLALISPLTGTLDFNTSSAIELSAIDLIDTAVAPGVAGFLARNGYALQWHDGSQVQTQRVHVGGHMTAAPIATSGTVEEGLTSAITLPDAMYDRTGWAFCVRAHWSTAANNNQKVAKIRIDDGSVTTTTTIMDTTANDAHLETTTWIWSLGTSQQRWQSFTIGATAGGTGVMLSPASSSTTMDQTTSVWLVTLRGLTPTASGDLTLLMSTISVEA